METFSIAQYRVLGLSCGGEPMTINIEWEDQFARWHHYQTKQNQADAYRVAQRRAESTKKHHRHMDDDDANCISTITNRK
jgi:hypothetical protein